MFFIIIAPWPVSGLISASLAACSTVGQNPSTEVDCKSIQSSCHYGRFWADLESGASRRKNGGRIPFLAPMNGARVGPGRARLLKLPILKSIPHWGLRWVAPSAWVIFMKSGLRTVESIWQKTGKACFDLMFPVELPAEALDAMDGKPQSR
ncbi:MAG: hypothetical protein BEV12_23830 [Microcystis aeruginosa CACIAM 03]|nr:MAG: hypothetical protein BEV12_23830 [Microcystis aeruginosa CACIAM 03]